MIRRIEIVPNGAVRAIVETYLGRQRTAMSLPMGFDKARIYADVLADGAVIVDHTANLRDPVKRRAEAIAMMQTGMFNPRKIEKDWY